MWDLIVSVPDHCLSFYFSQYISKEYINYFKKYLRLRTACQRYIAICLVHNLDFRSSEPKAQKGDSSIASVCHLTVHLQLLIPERPAGQFMRSIHVAGKQRHKIWRYRIQIVTNQKVFIQPRMLKIGC